MANRAIKSANNRGTSDVESNGPGTPQSSAPGLGQSAEEHLARERKYAEKLESARQAMLSMSQNAVDRERLLVDRLHDAQQVALRMAQAAAERARKLSDPMRALQVELTQQMQESIGREREMHNRLAEIMRLFGEIHQSLLDISRLEPAISGGDSAASPASGAGGTKRLLMLQGEALVVEAFRLLLHRNPDPSGLDHYLNELGRGASAAEIVWSIRYSPEGRRAAADVSDIRFALMRELACRIPLIGRLLRAIADTCGLIAAQRKRRAFEHTVVRKLEEANRVNREMRHQLLGIAQKMTQLESTMISRAPDQPAAD